MDSTMELDTSTGGEVDVNASLDAEIERVKRDISTVQTRKSALIASILSTPPLTTPLLTSPIPPSQHTHLTSLIAAQSHTNALLSHRLLTGVTIFHPDHPETQLQTQLQTPLDPARPSPSPRILTAFRGRKDVLGLRFERYSRAERRFLEPGFVVLERVGGSSEDGDDANFGPLAGGVRGVLDTRWKLAGHDLPGCVMVEEAGARYLDGDGGEEGADGVEDGGEEGRGRGLKAFVRVVQGELAAGLMRMDAIQHVRGGMPAGAVDVAANSSDAREVRIEWEGGRMGRLLLDTEGNIERAVATDENGKRDRSLEADLMGKVNILNLRAEEIK